jgi:hypothetical protein
VKRTVALGLLLLIGLPATSAMAEGEVVVRGSAEFQVGRPPPPPRYRRRPGPRLMAPLRIDIGSISAGSDYGLLSGAELSVGIHWASLSPQPTNWDAGLGVFAGAMSNSKIPTTETDPAYVGFYLDAGKSLSRGSFWRTWATGRLEYLASDAFGVERTSLGASAKLEAELYLSGVGIEPRGIFVGSYAIGLYVEGAARRLSDDISPLQLGVGLTLRTPLVWVW